MTSTEDLSEIKDVTEEKIVSALKERFLNDQIYTRVKHSLLIVVNPYKDSRETIQEISERYLAEYKNTDIKKRLPAHIFQHVNQAYFHMRRTRIDQSILLRYTYNLLGSKLLILNLYLSPWYCT